MARLGFRATPTMTWRKRLHDQNVQIPMFPVFPLNHVDLVKPFVETYRRLLPTLRRQTQKLFQCPGVCFPLSMGQLGQEPMEATAQEEGGRGSGRAANPKPLSNTKVHLLIVPGVGNRWLFLNPDTLNPGA